MTNSKVVSQNDTQGEGKDRKVLLRVDNLVKHFPIKAGVFKRTSLGLKQSMA